MKTKKKEGRPDMELRSEKVRKLLGDFPSWFEVWGVGLIMFIIVVFLAVITLVEYPHPENHPNQGESILAHWIWELKRIAS